MGAIVRRYRHEDQGVVWALSLIPHLGETADPSVPLDLPPRDDPGNWDELLDIHASFLTRGGDFLICEVDSRVVATGSVLPDGEGGAEVNFVRVHPALRRRGLGRMMMDALERRALDMGWSRLHLDTTVEQPEAVAFYQALGYSEIGRRKFPGWELIYFEKRLRSPDRA
ncbi:MAG: GNAT family N-acetyltransferase [Actinomycetota bacterium]